MKMPSTEKLAAYLIGLCLCLSILAPFSGVAANPAPGPVCLVMDVDRDAPPPEKESTGKLEHMSEEELQRLDKKLAEALILYYDGEYKKALPLFEEISLKIETMDIRFWLGTCAYKAGETELAEKKFKEILEIAPGLYRARLGLATAYYQAEKYELAKKEFAEVLRANPPEAVQRDVNRFLARIDEKTKRLFYNLRITQGIQHDSNVSAGPSSSTIDLPDREILTLDREEKELSDWVTVTVMSGSLLYDLAERKGLMWNTQGFLYNTHNLEHHKFDYTRLRLASGPWWVQGRYVFKAPVGYYRDIFEHEELFDCFEVAPNFEYFFNEHFSLKGTFVFSRDSYDHTEDHGKNNVNREWEINPNLYFNNRNDVISFYGSIEDLNATDKWYSYDAVNVALSYFKHLPWDMEVYVRYKYSDRDYEALHPASVSMGWDHDREDERHNVYAEVSQNFWKYYFVSLYFNWIDNDSNVPVYEFDKILYGLRLGVRF